jgi:hypothetical protein
MRITNAGSSERKKPGHKNRKRTIAIAVEGVDGARSERDRKTMNNFADRSGSVSRPTTASQLPDRTYSQERG